MKKDNSTLFISNLKKYMDVYNVTQKYLSKKTELDINKISRLINLKQDVKYTDMILISNALDRKLEYFLDESFEIEKLKKEMNEQTFEEPVATYFCMREVSNEIKIVADEIMHLVELADEILGLEKHLSRYGENYTK